MKAQLNAITIAVKDINTLKKFYTDQFGWEIMAENDRIVIFRLDHIMLSLYQNEDHAAYLGIKHSEQHHPQFYLTINTASIKQTDEVFAGLKAKGVNIIKEAQQLFWGGYGGVIADPEGNCWEICYNPVL